MIFPQNDVVMKLGRDLGLGSTYNDILHRYLNNIGYTQSSLPDQMRAAGFTLIPSINVSSIFSDGTIDGAVYDYSNVASLNETSIGTIPVDAATDPVGLSLDSRFGLALGPELVDTMNTAGAWMALGTNTVEQDGDAVKVTYVNNQYGASAVLASATGLNSNLTVGANYKITFEIKVNSGSVNARMVNTGGVLNEAVTSTSYISQSFVFTASSATINSMTFQNMSAGEIVWIKNISVKLLTGNHALQATAAARPTWSNRVNLLTQSNQFDTSPWAETGTIVEAQDAIAPDGTTTAWTLTKSLVEDARKDQSFLVANDGLTRTYSVFVKKDADTSRFPEFYVRYSGGTVVSQYTHINTSTGASVSRLVEGGGGSFNVTSFDQNYWRAEITLTNNTSGNTTVFVGFRPAGGSVFGTYSTAATGSAVIYGAQLEYGTTATRYQRVTTATDFDTVGFPYYLSFLGTDDSLSSATGGGGSAGFFWCGVVEPTGGAGVTRVLWDDRSGNTGYSVQITNANKLVFYAGNGAALSYVLSTASVDVGTKYLLTVVDDGTNLSVQINSAAAETTARPVVVAGTAGFTIGKTNGGASNHFIGNIYPNFYVKGTGLTDAEVASVQAWVRSKAGV